MNQPSSCLEHPASAAFLIGTEEKELACRVILPCFELVFYTITHEERTIGYGIGITPLHRSHSTHALVAHVSVKRRRSGLNWTRRSLSQGLRTMDLVPIWNERMIPLPEREHHLLPDCFKQHQEAARSLEYLFA